MCSGSWIPRGNNAAVNTEVILLRPLLMSELMSNAGFLALMSTKWIIVLLVQVPGSGPDIRSMACDARGDRLQRTKSMVVVTSMRRNAKGCFTAAAKELLLMSCSRV